MTVAPGDIWEFLKNRDHVTSVRMPHLDTLEQFFKSPDFDVNQKYENGRTLFSLACENGYIDIVALLLQHPGVGINCHDSYRKTPLMLCAELGHLEVCKLLLKAPRIAVDARDLRGRTALITAAEGGHHAIVALILEHFAGSVNVHHVSKLLALVRTTEERREEIDLLLQISQIDIDQKNRDGLKALLLAVEDDHLAIKMMVMKMHDNLANEGLSTAS